MGSSVTVVDAIASRAADQPDRPAIRVQGRPALTYAGLVTHVDDIVRVLRSAGVGPRDTVALVLPPSAPTAVVSLGILAGAVAAPLNPLLPEAALADALARLAPRLLVVDAAAPEWLRAVADRCGVAVAEVHAQDDGPAGSLVLTGPERPPTDDDPAATSPDHLALLLPTSGTTAASKLVPLTHGNLVASVQALAGSLGLGPDDSCVHVLPMHHIGGLVDVLAAPLVSGGSVLMAVPFAGPEVVRIVRQEQPTWIQLAPAMLMELLAEADRSPGALDGHRLRLVRSVSAPLPPALLHEAESVLGVPVIEIYGMTETAGVITSNPLADRREGTVGVPVGPQVRVVDADGVDVGSGGQGEIVVRGPSVMSGYVADAASVGVTAIVDGWLGTGDLGSLDADGYLRITGRVKDVINRGGEMISPADVDRAILDHPDVVDAAAFGAPHASLGESVAAVVVPRAGRTVDVGALRAWLGERLPASMVPRQIVAVDEVPRVNGKVRRPELVALLPRPGHGRDGAHTGRERTPITDALTALWCEVLGLVDVRLDDDFFALGGDSLRAASLVALLGSRTDDIVYVSSVFEAPTVAQFEDHLVRHYPRAAAALTGGAPQRESSTQVTEAMVERYRGLVLDPWAADPAAAHAGPGGNPRAVFILSAPRSGSTLLRSMLAGHPDLFAPPELYLLAYPTLAERTRYFPRAHASQLEGADRALMQALGVDAGEARARLAAMEESGATTAEMFRLLQDAAAPRRLVDKTPANALAVSTLQRAEWLFGEAVYIHLVRHPSAMIASFEEANLAQLWWPRIVGPDASTEPLAEFAPRQLAELLWITLNENIGTFLQSVPSDRRVRLMFEDLVTDPEAALRPVCERLGLPFSPRLLDPYDDTSGRMTDGLHDESRMIRDPKFHSHRAINPAAKDRWRSMAGTLPLSARAVAMASAFGYDDLAERPVTAGQARIWSLSRLDPQTSSYTVPMAFRLTGVLDPFALDRALTQVQKRHEVLRTVFPASATGEPTAFVQAPAPVVAPVVDSRWIREQNDPATADAEIRRVVDREARIPFDVEAGPLWRARVVRLADDEVVLVLALHHLVFDGLSRPILLAELGAAYSSAVQGEIWRPAPLAHQFAEVATAIAARERHVSDRDHAYWSAALATGVASLMLPTDLPREERRRRAHSITVEVPAATVERIREYCRGSGTTPAAAWLAGIGVVLHRWTGQEDLLVCVPTSGRGSEDAQSIIGYFNRLVPLRLDLAGDPRASDLVQQAAQRQLEAVDHDAVPMQELVTLPGMAGVAISRALVEYQEGADEPLRLAGLGVDGVPVRKGAPDFDLAIHIENRPSGLTVTVDADATVFHEATTAEVGAALAEAMDWLATHPDAPVSTSPSHAVPLADIERALASHPKVTEAVVVARPETGAVDAYLVLDEFDVPSLPEIDVHARACLPAYRVPAHYVSMGNWPRLADGTIDVTALPRPQGALRRPDSPAPRDELERTIADAWREVLWVDDEIGVHDSFRDRGGHSLLSVQLVSLLEVRLGRRIPSSAMLRLDTVSGLAEALRAAHDPAAVPMAAAAGPTLIDDGILRGLLAHTATWGGTRHTEGAVTVGLNTEGTRMPLFWVLQNVHEHEGLAHWLGPDQPVYAMRSGNRVMVKSDENIDLLARHYVEEILEIRPEGPYLVGGNCQAARIAVRIATHLRARGHEVPLLVEMEKFDPYPYDGPTAFMFGADSDRNPDLLFTRPEIGYAKFVTGPTWLRTIAGSHGDFFAEPNVQILARVLDEHLRWATDGAAVTGHVVAESGVPMGEGAYRAQLEVSGAPTGPLATGEEVVLTVTVTNVSAEDWPDGPHGGMSVGARWLAEDGTPGRVAATALLDAPVPRGGTASVRLVAPAPADSGAFQLEVDAVEQGIAWFQERGSAAWRLACVVGRGVPSWRRRVSRAGRLVGRARGTP